MISESRPVKRHRPQLAFLSLATFALLFGTGGVHAAGRSGPALHSAAVVHKGKAKPGKSTVPKVPKDRSPATALDCAENGKSTIWPKAPKTKNYALVKSFLGMARADINTYASRMSTPYTLTRTCVYIPTAYAGSTHDPAKPESDAETGVYDAQGQFTGVPYQCWIEVNPKTPGKFSNPDIQYIVAHEAFHCFQGAIAGLAAFWSSHPMWVWEGQASWAGASLVTGHSTYVDNWWHGYFENLGTSLFARTYDALGFYAHLQESGINVWGVLAPMLRASGDTAAFTATGASTQFLDTWASSYARDASRGRAWDTTGPSIPGPLVAGLRHKLTIANDQTTLANQGSYTEGLYALISSADIVSVDTEGDVRLSGGGLDALLVGHDDYCTRPGGCDCPAGSSYSGPPLTTLPNVGALFALTGADSHAKITLEGQSLADFCTSRDKCLIGTWRVTDESGFVATESSGLLTLVSTSGTQTMTFAKNGNSNTTSTNYTRNFVGSLGTPSSITLNGTSTAQWTTPQKGTLQFNNVDFSGVSVSPDLGPLGVPDSSTTLYTCNGNSLAWTPLDDPSITPIILTKISK